MTSDLPLGCMEAPIYDFLKRIMTNKNYVISKVVLTK